MPHSVEGRSNTEYVASCHPLKNDPRRIAMTANQVEVKQRKDVTIDSHTGSRALSSGGCS